MGRKPQTNQTNKNPKKEALLLSMHSVICPPTHRTVMFYPLPSLKRGKGKEAVLLLIKYPCEQIHCFCPVSQCCNPEFSRGRFKRCKELLTHILKNQRQGKESFCLALKQNACSRAPESWQLKGKQLLWNVWNAPPGKAPLQSRVVFLRMSSNPLSFPCPPKEMTSKTVFPECFPGSALPHLMGS